MFVAYFDHSSTGSGATRVLTLGWLVSTAARWIHFSRAWESAMRKGGAEGSNLHMTDLVNGWGDFRGWEADRRGKLLSKLVPVIRSYGAQGGADAIPVADFESIDALHHSDPQRAVTPLIFAFQAAIEEIFERVGPTEAQPLHCYMEEDQLVEADVINQFHLLRVMRKWENIVTLVVPLPKGPPPLQAVDLLAYEQSRYMSEQELSDSGLDVRPLWRELRGCRSIGFRHMNKRGLAEYGQEMLATAFFARMRSGLDAEIGRRSDLAAKMTQRQRSAYGKERKRRRARQPSDMQRPEETPPE
jgi:hypothetical protein